MPEVAPLFSIIVPTYHRNDLLANCLACLAPTVQSMPMEQYEVIVSDDGTRTTADEMIRTQFPWARWVAGPHRGPACNRNRGAKQARGEWLVFTDDDCLPEPGWLAAFAAAIASQELDVIEGRTSIPDKVDHPFSYGVESDAAGVYWSCNLAVRRSVFEEMGGFDEDFPEAGGEDMEFGFRVAARKLRSHFVSDAWVLHPTRWLNWRGLLKRTFMIRWFRLYLYKTGQAPSLSTSTPVALASLCQERLMELARTTWHLVSRNPGEMWRTRLFLQVWKWVMFPWVLAYLLLWEVRFRKLMAIRTLDSR